MTDEIIKKLLYKFIDNYNLLMLIKSNYKFKIGIKKKRNIANILKLWNLDFRADKENYIIKKDLIIYIITPEYNMVLPVKRIDFKEKFINGVLPEIKKQFGYNI